MTATKPSSPSSTPSLPLRVGLIGCGNVSGAYLANAQRFSSYRITACADMIAERSRAVADKHKLTVAASTADLIADADLDLVLVLTLPDSHEEIVGAALDAGKHVFCEKPLAITLAGAQRLVGQADAAGLRVGSAPDTFLGPGLRTCRSIIASGELGRPIAATAVMAYAGPEAWHPDPAFLYQPGAGPLMDMGPYYITALVQLLGPITSTVAMAQRTDDHRTIATGDKAGERFAVNTPTHVCAQLAHASGAISTMVMSFELCCHSMPTLEVYGTRATLGAPDPNTFGGPVRVRTSPDEPWADRALLPGPTDNARGIGLDDLCRAIADDRPHRASGAMALHVLEVLDAILRSAEHGGRVGIASDLVIDQTMTDAPA